MFGALQAHKTSTRAAAQAALKIRVRENSKIYLPMTMANLGFTSLQLKQEDVMDLLTIHMNGHRELSTIGPSYGFIPEDKKLKIPSLLATEGPMAEDWVRYGLCYCLRDEVVGFYGVIAGAKDEAERATTIGKIVEFLTERATQVKAATDYPPPEMFGLGQGAQWDERVVDVDGSEGFMETLLEYLAIMFGLNAHPRDIGMMPSLWFRDEECQQVPTMERFSMKLRPYTQQCMAAFNLKAVDELPRAAAMRAECVAMGMVPGPPAYQDREGKVHPSGTALLPEYVFSTGSPDIAHMKVMTEYAAKDTEETSFATIHANIAACFGILHLAADHTFKPSDKGLTRKAKAFLECLRTIMPEEDMTELLTHAEVYQRTAPHPFGLASTWYLMQSLDAGDDSHAAEPLAKRKLVFPPTASRLAMVYASILEWNQFPGLAIVNEYNRVHVDVLARESDRVRQFTPAFSALHKYYGIAKRHVLSDRAEQTIAMYSPMAAGYAISVHRDADQVGEGLALAQSLKNIQRDARTLVEAYGILFSMAISAMTDVEAKDAVTMLISLFRDTAVEVVQPTLEVPVRRAIGPPPVDGTPPAGGSDQGGGGGGSASGGNTGPRGGGPPPPQDRLKTSSTYPQLQGAASTYSQAESGYEELRADGGAGAKLVPRVATGTRGGYVSGELRPSVDVVRGSSAAPVEGGTRTFGDPGASGRRFAENRGSGPAGRPTGYAATPSLVPAPAMAPPAVEAPTNIPPSTSEGDEEEVVAALGN